VQHGQLSTGSSKPKALKGRAIGSSSSTPSPGLELHNTFLPLACSHHVHERFLLRRRRPIRPAASCRPSPAVAPDTAPGWVPTAG
jgi:hypothetical protein